MANEDHHATDPAAADAAGAPEIPHTGEAVPHTAAEDLHTGTESHGGGHGPAVFPPFNPETFAPQLIWLALTFVALYVLMSRVALPRIGEVLEERSDRIQRDLDTAERLKSETDTALADYEQALADARGSANEIAKETRDRLAAEVDTERQRIEGELDAKLQDAEKRIADTRTSALANVNDIASDVAGSVVEKLTGSQASVDELRQALAAQSGK